LIQWNQYPPTAYQWDYIPPSAWKTLNPLSGVVPGGYNDFANFVFQIGAMSFNTFLSFLQFSIDPSSLLNPIEQEIGSLLHVGYNSVFLPLFPVVVVTVALWLVYRFIRTHHTSVIQILFMFITITGMAVYFYTDFSSVMKQATAFDDSMAGWMLNTSSELGQAATGTTSGVNSNINNTLSMLWDQYVLTPWEQGEFGKASTNLADYNVSKQEVGQKWQDDNGNWQKIKPTDNWVNLMLSHDVDGTARNSLANILYDASIQRAGAYANAVAEPGSRVAEAWMSFTLMLPIVVFIGYMSCMLLILTLGFLVLVLKLAVTFAIGIVPEFGWNYFFKALKQIAGVLVTKVIHAMYLGITLLIFDIVNNALSQTNMENTMNGLIVNSAICVAAIVYRGWFIRSLSRPLPKEYQWSWKKEFQKVKIETQRGVEPWKNMASRASSMAGKAAPWVAPEAAIAATAAKAAKGNIAERFRAMNNEKSTEAETRNEKAPNTAANKGAMDSRFVREGDRFKTPNQSQTNGEATVKTPEQVNVPPKKYQVKEGQSVLKARMKNMEQRAPKADRLPPKVIVRHIPNTVSHTRPQESKPTTKTRTVRPVPIRPTQHNE
jgi:hypothetical protein